MDSLAEGAPTRGGGVTAAVKVGVRRNSRPTILHGSDACSSMASVLQDPIRELMRYPGACDEIQRAAILSRTSVTGCSVQASVT
jgi:hypothetical protein